MQAAAFVAATGVDALAVAVGSSHAMTTQTAELDLDLVAALRDAVPVPLVLHGSSGVPDDTLRDAVRAGIVKVNIGTALNVAYTGALREALSRQGRPAAAAERCTHRGRRHRRAPARRRRWLSCGQQFDLYAAAPPSPSRFSCVMTMKPVCTFLVF